MARQSKDLFDDSTMTFGEHLEALRMHLFKSLLGLILAVIVCLIYGEDIVAFVREPIDRALQKYTVNKRDVQKLTQEEWYEALFNSAKHLVGMGEAPPTP